MTLLDNTQVFYPLTHLAGSSGGSAFAVSSGPGSGSASRQTCYYCVVTLVVLTVPPCFTLL